ncbi:MAG: LysR family transcriptional regulator [Marmoricola sp.]
MFEVSRLTFLRAVHRSESVGAAARELGYTSSAVSQQIGKLEREVGTQLLEPAGRGVVLTEAALVLVEASEAIDAALETAQDRLETLTESLTGTLRLACFPSGIRGLAAPALRLLKEASPELQLHLKELAPEPALEALRGGYVDVALVHDWEHDRTSFPAGLQAVHLADDPVDLLVPVTHPLARRRSAELTETVDDVWVTDVSDGICTRWILDMLNAATTRPRVQFRAEEYASQVELVASGLCIAVLPRLGRPVLPETVRVVPLSGPVPTRRVHVVTRKSSATPRPSVALLLRALGLQVAG